MCKSNMSTKMTILKSSQPSSYIAVKSAKKLAENAYLVRIWIDIGL